MTKYAKMRYKSTLSAVIGSATVYALSKGYIDGDLATFVTSLNLAIFGAMNVASNRVANGKKKDNIES